MIVWTKFERRRFLASAAVFAAMAATSACQSLNTQPDTLAGTWRLLAADKELPDGSVRQDYGETPSGLFIVDDEGRYSLQIFSPARANFVSRDKAGGTDEEMRQAMIGASTHFGELTVDWSMSTLTFQIEDASFPNWRGAVQVRSFELAGDVLTYRVPPRSDGTVPISVWQRIG